MRSAAKDPASKNLPDQRAPNRTLWHLVELAPQAALAKEEPFVLRNFRPWNAENAFSASASSARIDQPVASDSWEARFYQAHCDSNPASDYGRMIEASGKI
jgi:hypothetical protein